MNKSLIFHFIKVNNKNTIKINIEENSIYGETFAYEGEILNNKKNGKGKLRNKSGMIIYIGFFKDNFFSGKGVLSFNNNDIYEGEFEDGKRNGYGSLRSSDKKYRYDGEWMNDEKHGKGYEEVSDIFVYDGFFLYGKKFGKGKNISFF